MEQTMKMKSRKDSFTSTVHVLNPANLNGYSRLFGGQLMSWMDMAAAVTARRHSERNVTTASVENLEFRAPAHGNDTLVIEGFVCYVGRTSMDVCVQAFVEELNGERNLVNRAHFIMVALDENERPVPVPGLLVKTPEEKAEWEEAGQRKARRSAGKKEN